MNSVLDPVRNSVPIVRFRFDGGDVEGRMGDSIASALLANGRRAVRIAVDGSPRGVFCGIGVCYDCIVTIDGVSNRRACVIRAGNGMDVSSVANRTSRTTVTNGGR